VNYKSDIEIAQQAKLKPISEIAKKLGIGEEYIESYGRYKAKIDYNLIEKI
jgi:formate--tetrahydrofolate ligase